MMSASRSPGRRMVITGASRGPGCALAITAADYGAELVLLARNETALRSSSMHQGSHRKRRCDRAVRSRAALTASGEACLRTLTAAPTIDVLINNAAPWLTGSISDLADEDIAAPVAAAVTGTVLITKGLLPGLRRSAAADIATLISTAALAGHLGNGSAAFHAAKHGQSGFSERLREELKNDASA